MSTAIVRIVSEIRSIVAAWRREGLRAAVVPTMVPCMSSQPGENRSGQG